MPDYSQLPALLPDVPVCILPETASTNADARALLLRGGAHGSLVVAARQTGGSDAVAHAQITASVYTSHVPAIGAAIEAELAQRRGTNQHSKEDVENFPPPEGKTRDLVAKATGFGNGKTYEQAKPTQSKQLLQKP